MNESQDRGLSCLLCGKPLKRRLATQPGYCLGQSFQVYHCPDCDTSSVQPMAIDARLYDAIYAHPEEISGYERYTRYARQVAAAPDPLAYLAGEEDVYWSIRTAVETTSPAARILEVGSGLGYLTYALHRRGYQVTGMELSRLAVERACARFGPLFQEADLAAWSQAKAGEFDMVIMAELIEHIPDPLGFLTLAAKLLKPGGQLVVTTPNKSCFAPSVLWETEAPPVHLWWFSEASMRCMAKRLGLTVSFVDFTPFNRNRPQRRAPIHWLERPTQGAKLDAAFRPLSRQALRRLRVAQRPWFYRLLKIKRFLAGVLPARTARLKAAPAMSRSTVLCAVMVKPW